MQATCFILTSYCASIPLVYNKKTYKLRKWGLNGYIRARRSIEQKLLMQSVGLMALVAVSGTIMGIVTGSSAVLLDGVFSFVDVVIKIMMLMTAKLIARETSKRFPVWILAV